MSIRNRPNSIIEDMIKRDIESKDPYLICSWVDPCGRKDSLNCLYEFSESSNLKLDLQDAILRTDQILHIYEFLFLISEGNLQGFNQEELEQEVIKSGNAKLMQYCLGFVKLINPDRMRKALYGTNNITYIEELGCDEELAEKSGIRDTAELSLEYQEALKKAKNATGNDAYFPKSLETFGDINTDINDIKEKVLASNDPYFVIELANWMEYLNKHKGTKYKTSELDKKIEQLEDPMGIYEYLSSNKTIEKGNRKALVKKLCRSNNIKFMEYTLKYADECLSRKEKKNLKDAIEGKYKDINDVSDFIKVKTKGVYNFFKKQLNKTMKKIKVAKEKIYPPLYEMNKLETRINYDTGEINIYEVISKDAVKGNSFTTRVTIRNIEDENDIVEYDYNHIPKNPVYEKKDPDKIKNFKSNFFVGSLKAILGEEHEGTEKITKKRILEFKENMQSHIYGTKYHGLYMLTPKNNSGNNTPIFAVGTNEILPEMKIQNINGEVKCSGPKGDVLEKVHNLYDNSYITTLHSSFFSPYDFKNLDEYDVAVLCRGKYNRYHDPYLVTQYAAYQIVDNYKRKHPELFEKTSNDLLFCPKVETPIAQKDSLPSNKGGILKQETEPVLPGEE